MEQSHKMAWLVGGGASLIALVGGAAAAKAPAGPDFKPGVEAKIEDAEIGGLGYYLVYVPMNYSPDRAWPLVFCYHGVNGEPATWPFRQATRGRDFIIVGMEYYRRGLQGYGFVNKDVENVKRIVPYLVKRLKIDKDRLFIGGFSMGGFMTVKIAGRTLPLWAGILILGASGRPSGAAGGYRGKAVYIGVGEKDSSYKSAQASVEAYQRFGARVTFDMYPGRGHEVDADSKAMRDWFLANGPLRHIEPLVAKARLVEKQGRLGEAYALYQEAAKASKDYGPCQEAAKAAGALAARFEAKLAEADQRVEGGKYPAARTILGRLAREYVGSEFKNRAQKRLEEIRGLETPKAPATTS